MDNLNDLKAIWQTADTSNLPQANEIIAEFKKYRNHNLIKKAWMVIVAVALTTLMIAIIFLYKSTFLTTRIGEGFILIADIILIRANLISWIRLRKLKDCSNQQFINYLHEVQVNRINYYRKTQVIGMAFSAAGILLYMIETIYKDFYSGLGLYVVCTISLAFIWFIVRPKAYKKRMKKFEKTLARMEILSQQLEHL